MSTTERLSSVNVSNVLSEEKRQQVIALGRLGWSLRRIQRETQIRRETAASYLKSAGIAVREPGWARRPEQKPAIQVTPDSEADSKPAIQVTPDPAAAAPVPRRSPSASSCEPWRDWIASKLAAGRNAKAIWQDLVDDHGFTATYQSVKRFVRKLQDSSPRQACAIIETAPGEEAQVDYGDGPMVRDPNTGDRGQLNFRRGQLEFPIA